MRHTKFLFIVLTAAAENKSNCLSAGKKTSQVTAVTLPATEKITEREESERFHRKVCIPDFPLFAIQGLRKKTGGKNGGISVPLQCPLSTAADRKTRNGVVQKLTQMGVSRNSTKAGEGNHPVQMGNPVFDRPVTAKKFDIEETGAKETPDTGIPERGFRIPSAQSEQVCTTLPFEKKVRVRHSNRAITYGRIRDDYGRHPVKTAAAQKTTPEFVERSGTEIPVKCES